MQSSIVEINNDTWLVGGRLVLSRGSHGRGLWEDSDNGCFTIDTATHPLPATTPLSQDSPIKLIHDVGDVSAVFSIGNSALCKVKLIDIPNATREHVTLAWLSEREWSFRYPTVFSHAEWDSRYYIFIGRVKGSSMDSSWSSLDTSTHQKYADNVTETCKDIAVAFSSGCITGVDGGGLSEKYLCGRDIDCKPESLVEVCPQLGMDCSNPVFYYCDLGPTNVLVDKDGSLGVIDWGTTGFVPSEWIKTKFRVPSGMKLSGGDDVLGYRQGSLHLWANWAIQMLWMHLLNSDWLSRMNLSMKASMKVGRLTQVKEGLLVHQDGMDCRGAGFSPTTAMTSNSPIYHSTVSGQATSITFTNKPIQPMAFTVISIAQT